MLELRYLTFKTTAEAIKIRVGTNFLMPFSKNKDIETVTCLMDDLSPILKKGFTEVDKTVSLSPEGAIKMSYLKK